MKEMAYLAVLLGMVSSAIAQTAIPNAAEIRELNVSQSGENLRVEVSLTGPVNPSVILATGPDRIVLELPNTSADAKQRHIPVNQNGVKSIRVGLNSATPLITRVVIDVDQARPYELSKNGNTVVLTVLPAANASASKKRRDAPAGAASAPIVGRLHGQRDGLPSSDNATAGPLLTPPPSRPPINFPEDKPSAIPSAGNATASSGTPSATHPNRASLQEGTVFPSMVAPGTGVVPPTNNGATKTTGINSAAPPVTVPSKGPISETALPGNKATGTTTPAQNQAEGAAISASSSSLPAASRPPVEHSLALILSAPLAPASPPSVQTPAVTPQVSSAKTQLEESASQAVAQPSMVASAPAPAAADQATAGTGVAPPPEIATDSSTPVPETDANVPVLSTRTADSDSRIAFKVKYVTEGAAYLDGGRSSGLSEGMKLEVKDIDPSSTRPESGTAQATPALAELEVISVAETSAVTEIHEPKRDVKPGDWAYLSAEDSAALVAQRSLSATRKYPAVVTFTEGDPLEEEAREEVPRPPLPEINRARGRIGFDYSSLISHGGSGGSSSSVGMMVRTDITRINGTYWNLSGYWRGRLTSRSSTGQPTLQDLINRTYHIGLTYDSPKSPWVAGFGRLYLPWAASLDTIDGGYFGRRIGKNVTTGLFAGSTPDPTSWDFNPDRRIGGAFVNFEGGSFDALRYTSTSGMGVSTLKWKVDRPFVFFENGIFYKKYLAIYNSLQADSPRGNAAVTAPGAGVSRSFLTVRVQPVERIEFDFNHNYFRDIPTFDPALIGTGLLDKYLFQGFSAGTRVEVIKGVWAYATLGKSSRSGDTRASLNELYGITVSRLPWTAMRADVHYSRFNSSFGSGSYESVSLSRNFHDSFRWEVLAGRQSYISTLATRNASHFINANLEAPVGPHYFFQGGFTWNRGGQQNYDQWIFTFGYRFDSRSKGR